MELITAEPNKTVAQMTPQMKDNRLDYALGGV